MQESQTCKISNFSQHPQCTLPFVCWFLASVSQAPQNPNITIPSARQKAHVTSSTTFRKTLLLLVTFSGPNKTKLRDVSSFPQEARLGDLLGRVLEVHCQEASQPFAVPKPNCDGWRWRVISLVTVVSRAFAVRRDPGDDETLNVALGQDADNAVATSSARGGGWRSRIT